MTDLRQAAQQALEALESEHPDIQLRAALTLRTALEQPELMPWRESASDYKRGVIDGMQKQAQSSVDKAVNAMTRCKWVGLTDEEIYAVYEQAEVLVHDSWVGSGTVGLMFPITLYKMFEAKLKEKNNG